MNQDAMNELFVELSSTFQQEFSRRIIAFLKDERKQKRWWIRFRRWLGSIKHLTCICGPTGVGCQCERAEELPMPPHRLPVRQSMSLAPMVIQAHPSSPGVPLVIPPLEDLPPREAVFEPYARVAGLTQITEI
jgi:hypothetical protein